MNNLFIMLFIDDAIIVAGVLTGNIVLTIIGVAGIIGLAMGIWMHDRQQKK